MNNLLLKLHIPTSFQRHHFDLTAKLEDSRILYAFGYYASPISSSKQKWSCCWYSPVQWLYSRGVSLRPKRVSTDLSVGYAYLFRKQTPNQTVIPIHFLALTPSTSLISSSTARSKMSPITSNPCLWASAITSSKW